MCDLVDFITKASAGNLGTVEMAIADRVFGQLSGPIPKGRK
jgi:hypothetical protein